MYVHVFLLISNMCESAIGLNMTTLQGCLGTGTRVSGCTKIKPWQLPPGMRITFTCKTFTYKLFTCKILCILHVKNLRVRRLRVKKLHVKVNAFYMLKTDM